ncbi:UDP-N-acetylglucosamine 1-carboxyvinyltransferase [Patescibacteria group bacterium]|nr:UDP-N-acetylglucosamine 1-carboxyvinyltransferase [Patescibacteria group bacterium]
MSTFIIDGPTQLNGTIKVGGSKNAVMAILPACLLATKPVTLHNVPEIRDVAVMLEILEHFGMKVEGTSGSVTLDPTGLKASDIPDDLAVRLRASITMLGPALARFGKVKMVHPGGDIIGKRPIDVHLNGLRALGASVDQSNSHYELEGSLTGAEIFQEEASVTGTESTVMAATLASGTTKIRNAASELHVTDLVKFLTTLGAKITGGGTNQLVVEGVDELGGGEHTIRCDEIEAGTLMIAAGVTGGTVTLTDVDPENFAMIPIKLREAGLNFSTTKDTVTITPPHDFRKVEVKTNLWPSFPSDLQAPFAVLCTQADGESLIHDWMYEERFQYVEALNRMGANIKIADPHRIMITGPTELHAEEIKSPDLRAGITLVVAAMIAKGKTIVEHAEWIDRGYERIDARLRESGVTIERVEDAPAP